MTDTDKLRKEIEQRQEILMSSVVTCCGERPYCEHCEERAESFRVLEQALGALPRWVSVEDELPPLAYNSHRSGSVLVWRPDNKCIYTATYDHASGAWEHFHGGEEIVNKVTKWLSAKDLSPTTGD